MSISYALYIATAVAVGDVMQHLFEIDSVAPIANTDIVYGRGSVYLVHGRNIASSAVSNKIFEAFGVRATMSLAFFPDGVSNLQTALNHLLEAAQRFIQQYGEPLLLLANQKDLVLQHNADGLQIATQHPFWTASRLERLTLPH